MRPGWRPLRPGWKSLRPGWRPVRPGWKPLRPGWRPLRPGWRPLRPSWRPEAWLVGGRTDVHTYVRTDGRTDKIPLFYRTSPPSGPLPKKEGKKNRSPKGNMWSVIPIALL